MGAEQRAMGGLAFGQTAGTDAATGTSDGRRVMGFLTDFARAFASNIGGELKQRRTRIISSSCRKLLERRRRQYQQEDGCVGARWATGPRGADEPIRPADWA